MKNFIHENFILQPKTAQQLYHEHAKQMPIIDYHSHLIPQQVAENRQFNNITQPWLYGDHYKWRAMRTIGINEHFITGKASDWEKFEKWAETVPNTLRNPLYHWNPSRIKRIFGIEDLLNGQSAKRVYEQTSAMLQTEGYGFMA
jgi:glucuronate isomerase